MRFVATLTHPPEQCFAREEYRTAYEGWLGEMVPTAKRLGVKINGAFVAPNEHTFYFVLEAESADAVSQFLGPPMLTHHKGRVSAVIDLEDTRALLEAFEQ